MKKDTETYFRAEKVNGEKMKTISPLCTAAVEKDRKAFTAVMRHIREIDEGENTVVVMQVENEIGLLGTDRDYSPAANAAFNRPIPEKLGDALGGIRGTWTELFGDDAGEPFMAWHFASAVETIAASGRKEYDLPCYANAWLRQSPWFLSLRRPRHPGAGHLARRGPVPLHLRPGYLRALLRGRDGRLRKRE